jgi:DNA repair protein RecO (recombination protein O)
VPAGVSVLTIIKKHAYFYLSYRLTNNILIRKSPAIVLRSVDFKESSRIVTLFTPLEGKISVMVRGAKTPGSKYSGLTQTGNILDVIYYYKSSRSVQTLSDAAFRDKTFQIQADYNKLAVAMGLLEMIDQLVHGYENSQELFNFTESVLVWLHQAEGQTGNLFPYILVRLADLMGVGFQTDPENLNLNPETIELCLNINKGSITNKPEDDLFFRLTNAQSMYVKAILENKTGSLLKINFEKNELKQLIYHLDVYLKHHIEGLRDRKSDAIFDQLTLSS